MYKIYIYIHNKRTTAVILTYPHFCSKISDFSEVMTQLYKRNLSTISPFFQDENEIQN